MMSVKITPQSKKVLIEIDSHGKYLKGSLKRALHEIGIEVRREVRRLIRNTNKTGRLYGTHRASSVGEAPANRTGKLTKSVNFNVRNEQEMSIGESAEYAVFLENGTKKIKPRPHLIAAINNKAGVTYNMIQNAMDYK